MHHREMQGALVSGFQEEGVDDCEVFICLQADFLTIGVVDIQLDISKYRDAHLI